MTARNQKLWAISALLLMLMGVLSSASLFRQDLLFTQARTEVSFWGRDVYKPTEATIARTNQSMDTLLHSAPLHPAYLSLQASSYAWQSYWAENSRTTQQFAKKAVQLQTQAVEARPAHLQSQAKLAEYNARLQDDRRHRATD